MKKESNSSRKVRRGDLRYANKWMSEHPLIVLFLGIIILVLAALLTTDALAPPIDRPDLARKTLMSQWLATILGVALVIRAVFAFLRKR